MRGRQENSLSLVVILMVFSVDDTTGSLHGCRRSAADAVAGPSGVCSELHSTSSTTTTITTKINFLIHNRDLVAHEKARFAITERENCAIDRTSDDSYTVINCGRQYMCNTRLLTKTTIPLVPSPTAVTMNKNVGKTTTISTTMTIAMATIFTAVLARCGSIKVIR